MAPKKKNMKNSFYFFMVHVLNQERNKGNIYKLSEIAVIASPLWENMTKEEKEPYEQQAVGVKKSAKDDLTKKFTSLGVSYATLEAEEREEEEARELMLATVRNTVRALHRQTTLKTHKFFVCHVNYFYQTDKNYFYPAEMSFAVFSLQEGIIDSLHFLVDPGQIPLGLKYEASDWSARTHGIPLDSSWKEGEKDHKKLYDYVLNFIKRNVDDDKMPPIYTMDDSQDSVNSLLAVRSGLNILCDAVNVDYSLFSVYSIALLFFELRNKCATPDKTLFPSVSISKSELEKDVFSYAKDLGCYFHEEKDNAIYCSLSIVARWIFTICDHCCKHLNIRLILRKHIPQEADIDWGERSKKKITNGIAKDTALKPLTIIDHGLLKERRAEERDQEKQRLEMADKVRLPLRSYGDKIGAKFSQESGPSTSCQKSVRPPVDISSGPSGLSLIQSEASQENDDNDGWIVRSSRRLGGRGRGAGSAVAPTSNAPIYPVSGRGRSLRRDQ